MLNETVTIAPDSADSGLMRRLSIVFNPSTSSEARVSVANADLNDRVSHVALRGADAPAWRRSREER
jgi:hypothetical protein